MHGVLVDIYGLGVLITGSSGVGKSETALELVKRGHRLVADDNVEIRQEDELSLIGSSPAIIEHLQEPFGRVKKSRSLCTLKIGIQQNITTE